MRENSPGFPSRKSKIRALGYLLVLLLFNLAVQGFAQESPLSLRFTAPGRLAVLIQGIQGQFILNTIDTQAETVSRLELTWPEGLRPANPALKQDQNGRLFAVWEEFGSSSSRIGFGPVSEAGFIRPEALHLPQGGNSLPDLAFDAANGPWLIWDNGHADRHELLARQGQTGQTWVLAGAGAFLAPQVVCDGLGRVWVFWGETSPTRFRILCRVFNGGDWTPPQVMIDAGPFAIQSFRAILDERGLPWLAWSQHGSPGYAIHALPPRDGLGEARSEGICLASGEGAQHISPDIIWAAGLGPVVTWTRFTGRKGVQCMRILAGGAWSETVAIPGVAAGESVPRAAVAGGRLAVGWRSDGRLAWREFPLLQLSPLPDGSDPWPSDSFFSWWLSRLFPTIINNPDLDESAYIGFGDSITYGVINHEYTPELGYVPRLEAILEENYGLSTVVNSGVGGEITLTGLARIPDVLEEELARYILILEGTNDTIISGYNPDVTVYNLQQMVVLSREFGAFPALGTLLPRFDAAAQPQRIVDINSRIRGLGQTMLLPVVDFYTLFMEYPSADGGVMSLLSEDVKHPSEKGYQFMADKWFEAIRNFPFPPEHVQVSREYDKILFYEKPGNMINWQDNEKITDPTLIRGYRIYRKLRAAEDEDYELIAFVEGTRQHFDTAISTDEVYAYVIATVMTDGVEGACCLPVNF